MVLRKFGAVAILVMQASAAWSQHPLVLNKLEELNRAAPQPPIGDIKSAVLVTAKAMGEANKTCIPAAVEVSEIAPVTGARDVLQAVMGGQVKNGWTVYATHAQCPGTFRYMIIQKNDGSLFAPLVNEGRTYANPAIMRDTSANAALAALQKIRSVDASCEGQDMSMGKTGVVDQSKDLGPEVFGVRYVGTWSEVWRFKTCGKEADVVVKFRADGDGGAYTDIPADQVVLVQ